MSGGDLDERNGALRLAEEALAKERDLVSALMDRIPDFIYFKDLSGRFLRVNRALAARYGHDDARDMIGKTDFDLFEASYAQGFQESERCIIETGEPLIGVEEYNVQLDGSKKWVSTSKLPFRDGEGNIIGTFGISRDITERKISEERLMRSEKMASLGRLTAGIAHEMNTPLAAARAALAELGHLLAELDESIGDAEITVEDQRAIGGEMKGLLAIANGCTERAATFVRAVKTQTRDVKQEDRHRFDAVKVIDDALLLLGHDFRTKRCTVQFEHGPEPVFVLGVPGRLVQVVNNLVNNAADASAAAGGGLILVTLAATQAGVELRVKDNGCGIKEVHLAKIFEPMFTTKPFGEGTGLGLSIVYDVVVAEFGGSIDVSSREGEGATFFVRFPAA